MEQPRQDEFARLFAECVTGYLGTRVGTLPQE